MRSFSSDGFLGMEVLRRRINDRVLRWQNGDCPTIDHLNVTQVTWADDNDNAFNLEAEPPR